MYNQVLTERVCLLKSLSHSLICTGIHLQLLQELVSGSYYWIATSIFVVKYHSHKQFGITFPLWMGLARCDNENAGWQSHNRKSLKVAINVVTTSKQIGLITKYKTTSLV